MKSFNLLKFYILLLTILSNQLFAGKKILSNPENQSQSFDFDIKTHISSQEEWFVLVGAAQEVPENNFALAISPLDGDRFIPLAPEKATINNVQDQENPLNGASIQHLNLLTNKPIIVTEEEKSTIYALEYKIKSKENNSKFDVNVNLFKSDPINNSTENETPNILSIDSGTPISNNNNQERFVFAAVTNDNGSFDGNGSGIAFLKLQRVKLEKDEQNSTKTTLRFNIFDASTGESQGNKAIEISKNSPFIKIDNDLSSISNNVDIFYDNILNRFYVALEVQSGNNPNDGARAIVVGQALNDNRLMLQEIVSSNAISSDDKIIGSIGSNTEISTNKVRVMHTSTHLCYLIVTKKDSNSNKINQVFAMPLVNNTNSQFHGTLANVNSDPKNIFMENCFITRSFFEEAQNPNELYDENSIEAKVGGNGSLPSNIIDIKVIKDAVFVATANDGNNQSAGVFYSQAIFEQNGKIKGWTDWKKATDIPSIGFELDNQGNFIHLSTNNGQTSQNVIRTCWSEGESDLEKIIEQSFSQTKTGVLGLFDFPPNTQSFNQNIGQRISIMTLTGKNEVLLIQSGKDDQNNIFRSNLNNLDSQFVSEDGSLNDLKDPTDVISISGGQLENLNSINSATIASDSINGWLLVGGTQGLAILTDANGNGWSSVAGLSKDFSNLINSNLSFKEIGSFKKIRKLIAINDEVYILTNNALLKIKLDSESIRKNEFDPILLASSTENNLENVLFFSDVIISPPISLLATSNGLFRSGNNVDISKINSEIDANWTEIRLPESAGSFDSPAPTTRFFSISPTNKKVDVFKNGNLYVLNAYVGFNQAQIYRLDLNFETHVSENSVKLFDDLFVLNKPSFFVDLGDYRNFIFTDGAFLTASRSAFFPNQSKLFLLPIQLKSGQKFGAKQEKSINLNIENSRSIGQLTRNSASGAWIVPGDFGIRINQ